jgi:hypothetical protein
VKKRSQLNERSHRTRNWSIVYNEPVVPPQPVSLLLSMLFASTTKLTPALRRWCLRSGSSSTSGSMSARKRAASCPTTGATVATSVCSGSPTPSTLLASFRPRAFC